MSKEFLKNLIIKIEVTFGGIRPASKALNVDYTTLWRWKNGKHLPNTATLYAVRKSLDDHDSPNDS
jgi:hypothetical protein